MSGGGALRTLQAVKGFRAVFLWKLLFKVKHFKWEFVLKVYKKVRWKS